MAILCRFDGTLLSLIWLAFGLLTNSASIMRPRSTSTLVVTQMNYSRALGGNVVNTSITYTETGTPLPWSCSPGCVFFSEAGVLRRTRGGDCTCYNNFIDWANEGIIALEPGIFADIGHLGTTLLVLYVPSCSSCHWPLNPQCVQNQY